MYKIAIIDDNNEGVVVLKEFLNVFNSYNVIVCGTATNLQDGITLIKDEEPDIVFIDIEMPNEKGIAVFDYFKKPSFKIIFVTGHTKYAIEVLNKGASGYLLKPYTIVDFHQLLKRTIEQLVSDQRIKELEDKINVLHAVNTDEQAIMLETQNGFVMESFRNIEYCYANQSYSIIVLHTKKEITLSKPLKRLEQEFPKSIFYRTHKSYLININYIRQFNKGKNSVVSMRSGAKIPVSVRKSRSLMLDIKAMLTKRKKIE